MMRFLAAALGAACLAGCASPPDAAYVGAAAGSIAPVKLGLNAVGEDCTQNARAGEASASVYCGTWQQPSARIVAGGAAGSISLASLAAGSPWRVALDRRVVCGAAEPATVLGEAALLFRCTRRAGGWPHVALVTQVGGRVWYADGVASAVPAMERGIGVLSGRLSAETAAQTSVSAGLAAQRLAAEAASSNDLSQYERLMTVANYANLAGNYAGAESAYRAVAALQVRVMGPNAPGLSRTQASEALQLSDQGRSEEAQGLFGRAEAAARAPGQSDATALPLVWHYRGLDLLNNGHDEAALLWLRRAEAAYAALLPPRALAAGHVSLTRASASGLQDAMDSRELLEDDTDRSAIYGVIETRRAEAVALGRLGRLAESDHAADSAVALLEARGLANNPRLAGRVFRTDAMVAAAGKRGNYALGRLEGASKAMSRGLPGSVAYAETGLLLAGRQADAGHIDAALANCDTATRVLRDAGAGVEPALIQPCLRVMAAHAGGDGGTAYAKMFEVAQLAQGTTTSLEIAKASARLAETARDPHVGTLIRAHDDLNGLLADLYAARDRRAAAHQPADAALDKQIADAAASQADTDSALQAASPNYWQLVQHLVSAHDVLAALRPGEVFASTMLGPTAGWVFLLRDNRVIAAPIEGGEPRIAALVGRVRASLDAEVTPPPAFDTAAAHALYEAVFGGVSEEMRGATALTVAPSGPLLSVPFALLLTGNAPAGAQPASLAEAPWLIRHMVIAHVPAPANFVTLRRLAATARASQPWFGFGAFRPVTLAQALASYPKSECGESATLMAGLPPLPGAVGELNAARRLTHGDPSDELLGQAFTAEAVLKTSLKSFRILHFATHAILPTDLKCQSEPALVTSAPAGAHDASGALLTASQVTEMDLDADAVVLSACNTGGPAGSAAGESLTGLARSFFYAGARSLLVTHWAVNDRMTAYLVALSLAKATSDPDLGMAASLAYAQRRILADAHGDLSFTAHPFYWAPIASIGEGGGSAKAGS